MNEDNNKQPNGNKGSDARIFIRLLTISIILTVVFNLINTYRILRQTTEIPYSTFIDWINKDYVESVEFQSSKIEVTLKKDASPDEAKLGGRVFRTGLIENDALVPLLIEKNVKFSQPRGIQLTRGELCFVVDTAACIYFFPVPHDNPLP